MLYRLELLWKDAFCMQLLADCNVEAAGDALMGWLRAASIILALRVRAPS
jgi:hypothetical protein